MDLKFGSFLMFSASALILLQSLNAEHSIRELETTETTLSSTIHSVEYKNETASSILEHINGSDSPKKRSKRFLFLNMDGSFAVGFLLTIPLTIVLPPMSNLFNAWRYSRRFRRDVSEELTYEEDAVLQPSVERVQTYFDFLKIPETDCQQRAICEFSSDPDLYFPLADLMVKEIREPNLLAYANEHKMEKNGSTTISKDGESKPNSNLFLQFNEAAVVGLTEGHSTCHTMFRTKCPFSIKERLNLPTLQFWKMLNSILEIKFHH